jgi:hypothetical protein
MVAEKLKMNFLNAADWVNSVKLPFGFIRVMLTVLLLTAGLPALALDVSGVLSSGTWSIADSPVRVTGDVSLPAGQSLTIDPGVRVEFTGPYVFNITGMFDAAGKGDSLIVFTSSNPGVDSLAWGGLRFIQAQRGCRMHFTRVEYGWARGDWPLNCGGGIYIESCSPSITRTEISNNRANADGGGIYGWFTTSLLQNVLIHSNKTANFGGGVFVAYSSPTLLNCTVALDTAGAWGGGIFAGAESRPILTNCIVTHNTHRLWEGDLSDDTFIRDFGRTQSAHPVVSFSAIGMVSLNPYPGSGNIWDDPTFRSLTRPYDFHLSYSSPCVDAGDPRMSAGSEPDILVNRVDMGAYGGTDEATPSVPVIWVNFSSLNYDSIRINSFLPKEIRVENRGHYRLYLRDFQFSNAAFYPDSAEVDTSLVPAYKAAPIEPGESAKFTIFFRPTQLVTYRESVTIVSTDTTFASPVITLRGTGIDPVAVMPDTLLFSRTALGSRNIRSLYMKNRGRSPLEIRDYTLQGEGFSITVVDENVAPGDSAEIRFTFAPTRPETYEASVSFDTNDRDLFVYMLGRGAGPSMVVPDSARFMGYVYFGGDSAVSPITIRNTGDEPLVVNSAVVTDTVNYSVTIPGGSLTIAPDSTRALILTFRPSSISRNFPAVLRIGSNYPRADSVMLSGRGMAEPGQYVFGVVSGVWPWTVNSADYIVLDSVYIPAGERLKIEPGARVLFEPGAFFQADGEVRAVGRPGQPISFIARDRSGTDSSRWEGMYLSISDASRFSYCRIEGSQNGVSIDGASPVFRFCTFENNGDSARSGDVTYGGAVSANNSGVVLSGCTFTGNRAVLGGAIFLSNSKPTIGNCTFTDNSADDGFAIYTQFLSGGVYQSLLVHDNVGPITGGAVTIVDRSAPHIVNCTIVDNPGFGLRALDRSLPAVINTILWGNDGSINLRNGGNALVSTSDVEGGFEGAGNLNVVPMFTSTPSPYSLADGSPLIDRGNPETIYRDYFFPPSKMTPRNDIGAYGGPLGGGFGVPEVSIIVFQNPAFPRWLDVTVTTENSFAVAPVCSIEFEGTAMQPVNLTAIDASNYRGSIEATTEGTVFITSNAQLPGPLNQKVGRTFELMLNAGTGSVYLAGLQGTLTLPSNEHSVGMVMAGIGSEVVKPEVGLMPVSSSIRIDGLAGLANPATLSIALDRYRDVEGFGTLGAYQLVDGSWIRLSGRKSAGDLQVDLAGDGEFILAFGPSSEGDVTVPGAFGLLTAYPNPFNGGVTLSFDLSESSDIQLSIYDIRGGMVKQWSMNCVAAGTHSIHWNAASGDHQLPSGIYWARLATSGADRTTKLLLVR